MELLPVSCYTLGVCLVVWMQYKLICENLANMLLLHPTFLKTFAHIWSSWHLAFVMLLLQREFHSNLSMKFNNSYLVLNDYCFLKYSTLKSFNIMIRQCFSDCSIIFWSFLKNVKIKNEWALYTHTICIVFRVLSLKVIIMYYELLLVITFKESKCMCMSYIIINPWPSWIETYEYLNKFIKLCTSIDVWCICVFIRHNIWDIWKLWSWLMYS
jgi:hypothetical protein